LSKKIRQFFREDIVKKKKTRVAFGDDEIKGREDSEGKKDFTPRGKRGGNRRENPGGNRLKSDHFLPMGEVSGGRALCGGVVS